MPRRNLSWEFTTYECRNHPDGTGAILRPMVPITLGTGSLKVDTMMLLDSGADFPLISKDVAEAIGINYDDLRKTKTSGVGGVVEVGWADIDIQIGQRQNQFEFRWPFQVSPNIHMNKLPLLGREPLFSNFDVSFRMKYADIRGKFILSEVKKTRNPSRSRRS